MTLEEFAKFIELSLHQPVVNQTGLEGNFRVDFTPDESVPRFYRPQNANAAGGGQTFRDARPRGRDSSW